MPQLLILPPCAKLSAQHCIFGTDILEEIEGQFVEFKYIQNVFWLQT